jgi:hypothetical protein
MTADDLLLSLTSREHPLADFQLLIIPLYYLSYTETNNGTQTDGPNHLKTGLRIVFGSVMVY